jgi:hypothetical protein
MARDAAAADVLPTGVSAPGMQQLSPSPVGAIMN